MRFRSRSPISNRCGLKSLRFRFAIWASKFRSLSINIFPSLSLFLLSCFSLFSRVPCLFCPSLCCLLLDVVRRSKAVCLSTHPSVSVRPPLRPPGGRGHGVQGPQKRLTFPQRPCPSLVDACGFAGECVNLSLTPTVALIRTCLVFHDSEELMKVVTVPFFNFDKEPRTEGGDSVDPKFGAPLLFLMPDIL